MRFFWLLVSLLFFSALHASLETVLPSPIHGSVNVITGQYVEGAPQIVLNSPFELGLMRSYIGPDKQLNPRCWSMGSSYLSFDRNEPGKTRPNGIVIDDPSGSRLLYAYKDGRWVSYPEGTNHPNISFSHTKKGDETLFRVDRDRERFIFSSPNTKDPSFFAHNEEWRTLPLACIERSNGERVAFRYEEGKSSFDARPCPTSMTLFGPSGQTLGWIQYDGQKGLIASDGQTVECEVRGATLRSVSRPGWPTISYTYNTSTHSHYTKAEQKHLVRLARRQEGDLFLENSYYEAGHGIKGAAFDKDNQVQHPLINCVKEQFANVGEDPRQKISIAKYSYHFDPKKDFYPERVAGWADVTDATGNRTHYRWCEGERIETIEHYQGRNRLLVRETYPFYGNGGRLMGKVVSDTNGPVMAITAEQSSTGNILSHTLWGDLTGKAPPLQLDENGFPKEGECDCFCCAFEYLPGGRVKEERVGCLRRVYEYKGDRVASVALFDGERLHEQLSFEYNESGVVTQQTRTCGSRTYITKIKPIAEGPAIGLPERIEEYAGDQFLGAIERQYGLYNLPTSETYYDANNVSRYTLYAKYDDGGRPVWITNPEGMETTLTYDDKGRLVSDGVMHYTYDHANRPTSVSAAGLTCHYQYDHHSRIVRVSGPLQTATFRHDALDRIVESPEGKYEYDALNNCTKVTNLLGEVERYRYTVRGQITEAYYADGTSESFVYDLDGNLIERRDPLGITTKATYNGLGQITSMSQLGRETLFTYDGDLLIAINDGTLKTQMEYDAAGRLIEAHSGERRMQYAYDELGRQCKEIVWCGENEHLDTVWEHDLCNRVTQERLEGGYRVDYRYDKAGNVASVTTYGEQGPEVTRLEYDALGRMIRSTDPLGYPTTYTYGKEDAVTDPLGNVTKQRYDNLGQIASVETIDSQGTLLASTDYAYDASGQLTQEDHHVIVDGQVIETQSIRYNYGPGGRLEAVHEPMGKTTRFEYNHLGQLAVKVVPAGDRMAYTYDDWGHLQEERGFGYFYRYTYDANGNIVRAEGPDAVTGRTYDLHGQLTKEELSNGHAISYAYDHAGRRVSTHLPDGSTIRYSYDSIGVCEVKRDLFTHTIIERDRSGRPLLERSEPFGLEWSYKWDQVGRLIEERSPNGITHLAYDELGRLSSAQGQDRAGLFRESYTYDNLLQLTSESGTYSNRWTYDSLGNRRTINGASCTPDLLNRCSGGYDRNHRVQNIDGNACDYDGRNQLTLLNNKNRGWSYTYDPFGRRVKERHRGTTRDYLYDGDVEIGSLEGDRFEMRFTMPRGGWQRPKTVGLELNGELFSASTNHRGDITALFDQEGACVETMRYSSFGEQEIFGREISPWGFSGKRHDPSGFVYFGRRYYLPSEGRWMSPDPAGFADGSNLYQFCHNNPHAFIDWIGLKSESLDGGSDFDLGGKWDQVGQKPREGSPIKGYIYFGPPIRRVPPRPTKIRFLPPKLPLRWWTASQSVAKGVAHGTVRYGLHTLHDLWLLCAVSGASEFELDERMMVMDWVEKAQARQSVVVDQAMMRGMGVDESDSIYRGFLRGTEIGLEVATLAAPVYGIARGVVLPQMMGRVSRAGLSSRMPSFVRCISHGRGGKIRVGVASKPVPGQLFQWGFWGDYPKVTIGKTEYAKIGDRLFTRHAVDRTTPSGLGRAAGGVRGRSVSPVFVEEVISSPESACIPMTGPKGEARISHILGSIEVITEGETVITIITH